jgi:hypothetical protein
MELPRPGARDTHRRAVALALLVTFLWSTSCVLIKIGLRRMPPLPFAGLQAWVLLGEAVSWWEGAGMTLAACGGVLVQQRRGQRAGEAPAGAGG